MDNIHIPNRWVDLMEMFALLYIIQKSVTCSKKNMTCLVPKRLIDS